MRDQENLFRGCAVPGIEIQLAPFQRYLIIKCWGDPARSHARALDAEQWPAIVGSVTLTTKGRALCVSPQEWHWVSSEQEERPIDASGNNVVVDATHAFTAFSIRGSWATELLAKGCALDFHERSFPIMSCARTRFAGVTTLICRTSLSQFEMFAARSFAVHVYECLQDASVERRVLADTTM